MRGKPHTTTLPQHLSDYVEGLAKIQSCSVSQALVKIVEDHFEQQVRKIAPAKEKVLQTCASSSKCNRDVGAPCGYCDYHCGHARGVCGGYKKKEKR